MGGKIKAAFENRTNAWLFDPSELVLVTDPQHPLFDPRINLPLDEALVRNIMFQGVIEPIVIVKQDDKPVVVDGRQRVRCAVEANKRLEAEGKEPVRVTAVVRRGTEADLFGVSISANENRQDDTPLGRAKKCARLLAMGRSDEEAAIAFGVTASCVRAWMKLLDCAPQVREAVESGALAATAAAKLASLPAAEQVATLEKVVAEGKTNGKRPSVRAVSAAAGKPAGKMRSRREVAKRLEECHLPPDYRAALEWVIGTEQ